MPDGPSFFRRTILGAITLLGLFHGLRHLAQAILLTQGGYEGLSRNGLFSLLVVATLVAAFVAGTVNRRAELTGILLALGAAGGYLGPEFANGSRPTDDWMATVAGLLFLIGLTGGIAGRLVMPPAPRLPQLTAFDTREAVAIKVRPVPLSWVPIVVATILVVAGTLFADAIRNSLSRALIGSGGTFGGSALITWQVSVLAALIGGLICGANSRVGLKQGFVTGMVSANGIVAATVATGTNSSVLVEFWLYQLDQNTVGPITFAAFGASVWVVTAVGGWLGGQLFPPRRRK
jgi:hypothetical protein